MLPSLGALSLGAPTGAQDDVVTEIMDEREAEKREWEAWHREQEMKELPQEMERLREQAMALRAQESFLHALHKAARAQNEALSRGEVLTLDEAVNGQAVRERSLAPAEARAAPAAESSDDESDDEPLDRRADRLAPKSPPIHMLEPGPFSLIADELAKRLRPGRQAIKNSDADALCRDVEKACRELATLNRLPGQAVHPYYDCSDPNAQVWRGALVIFGVDPFKKHVKKMSNQSRKDGFRDLCQVFNPQQGYFWFDEGHSEPRWYDASLWATLKMMYEEGEVGDTPEYERTVDPETAAFARKVRRPLGTGTEVITWRLRHLPGIREKLDSIESDLTYSYKQTKKDIAEFRARAHDPDDAFSDNYDSDDDDDDDDEETDTHGTVTTLEDYEYPAHEEDYQNDVRRFRALKLLLKTLQLQAQAEADRLQMAPVSPRSLHGV